MKELTIEQKAQRYDEALERAKGVIEQNPLMEYLKMGIEYIFPELKESEDERIRKALMQNLKERFGTKGNMGEGLDMPDVLAWLEKQGEQSKNEDKDILHRFSFYSYKDEPNILYLAGLYVDNEYRNKGIGTKILKVANEVAASMKCNSIRLKTEKGSHAEKLYRENGYKTLKEEGNQIWLEKQRKQKPQSQWKPSDEYMKFLWKYAEQNNYDGAILTSLYKDLKKLREE